MKKRAVGDWILRFAKGAFIGTGFILPGVSGGALAAIFGLYERLIAFLAHLGKNFKSNVLFFLPVGLGMLAGIVLLSYPLGFFLEHYAAPTLWFFIGAILGTLPALWKQAGKKGRKPRHVAIMLLAAALGFALLYFGAGLLRGGVAPGFGTWVLAGAIVALGVLVPGLSPSNFLLYMGMYGAMIEAFQQMDLLMLVPIALGGAVCMLLFSKLVDKLFQKAYAGLFHVILGVVIASTLMILPLDYPYLSWGGAACALTCLGGILLGRWMSRMEDRYKPAKD